MQAKLTLSLLGIALFASMAVAQVVPPIAAAVPPIAAAGVVPPIVPPIGLGIPPFGLGIPPFGFGFPPFFGPWGGLGLFGPFGLGLGFGRFGLGLGLGGLGFGRFGGLGRGIGRFGRDVSDVEDQTFCDFNSKDNMVNCRGVSHNFECKVAPHFADLKETTYRVQNLTVVPDIVKVEKVEHQIYNLFSVKPTVGEVNDFTLIEKPERRVTFSVWKSSEVRRTGLRFVEEKCWKSFETLMAIPERVQFSLHITRE